MFWRPLQFFLLLISVVGASRLPAAPSPMEFVAPDPIGIGDADEFGPGLGGPYPSTIFVTGLTATVSKVTVTLYGLNHTAPVDLDLLLVGPGGQSVLLMSDCGSSFGEPALNVTATFDDAAANGLPSGDFILSGVYRPTDYGPRTGLSADFFPAPAPLKPWGSLLSVFNGTNPNGLWSLYVLDDLPEDVGSLDGGWSLTIATLNPLAELSVAEFASPSPVGAGSNLTYTITLTNGGPAAATEVKLIDLLPSQVTFVSAVATQGDCTNQNGIVTCAVDLLASGTAVTATIVVRTLGQGALTNVVSADGNELDLHLTNNAASLITMVTAVTDLSIGQAASTNSILQGQLVTYSISLTNRGPALAHNVRIFDALPAGVTFVSAVASQGIGCTNSAVAAGCNVGTLGVNERATVTVVARPMVSGSITNIVRVAGDEADYITTNDTAASVVFVQPVADLSLRIDDSPDPVGFGQNLTYILTVMNNGPSPAGGIQLTDALPTSVIFVAAAPSQGDCTNKNGVVTCALGALAAGASAVVAITVTPTSLGDVTNAATVRGLVADLNSTNNASVILSRVNPAADLMLFMTDGSDPAAVNAILSYTLTVSNRGPHTASGVTVSNPLPAGVTYIFASSSQGNCALADGSVICQLGSLSNAASATVTLQVRPGETGILTNSATVSGNEADLIPANNLTSQTTAVIFPAVTFANPNLIAINDLASSIPYPSQVTVSNLTATIYKVTLTLSNLTHGFPDDLDILLVGPGGQAVVVMSDAGGSTAISNVTVTLDDLASSLLPDASPLSSGTYRPLNAEPEADSFPPPAPPGPYSAALSIFNGTNPNGIWSLFVMDDAAGRAGAVVGGWSVSIQTIDPMADLAVTITGRPNPVAVDGDLTYTIIVTNRGPSAANGVRLTNELPATVNFVSATASQGSCSNDNGIVSCALNGLAIGGSATVTILAAPTLFGLVTNTVTVTANSRDFISLNDSAVEVTGVADPPTILSQPESQTVLAGATVTFTVFAADVGTLIYQWQRDGVDLPNATNSSLVLNNVTPADMGSYAVLVGNGFAAVLSDPAILLVRLAPTISDLSDVATDEDTPTPLRTFVIGDFETAAEALMVSAVSSNPTLVPNANIFLGGNGSNRTVMVLPALDLSGTATITITVIDADSIPASDSFLLTVRSVNDRPNITDVPDQGMNEDIPRFVLFAIGDVETPASNLVIRAVSANPSIIADQGLVITGTGSNRTLTITPVPNQFGPVTITVTVTDVDGGSAEDRFVMTVNPINDLPTMNVITNRTIQEESPPQTITLSGITSGASNEVQTLVVMATSLNPGLIPDPSLVYVSPDTGGTLTFAPLTNQSGTATIRVTVNDGASQNNLLVRTFTVTVTGVNDLPTISDVSDQTTAEDTPKTIAFIVGDVETAAAGLMLSATSSNTNLLPEANIVFGGSGSNRTALIRPATNQVGTTTVVLSVTDSNGGVSSDSFTLTVTPVIDPPFIVDIPNQSMDEDTVLTISVVVGDVENGSDGLRLTAVSSNPALLPNANVILGGTGGNRTLTFRPVTNQFGNATITVTLTNVSGASVTDTFNLAVNAVNDPPTLNPLMSVTLDEGAGLQVLPLSGIRAGPSNETQTLTVTASSSDTNIVGHPTVAYFNPNTTGLLSFSPRPDANGLVTITVTVNDHMGSNNLATRTFTVTLNPVNDLPSISDIPSATGNEDVPLTQPFTIGDLETPAADLVLSALSSNPDLVPPGNVLFGGVGANRTVTVRPITNLFGSATITVMVSDANGGTVSDSFVATFLPVNDPPTLAALPHLRIEEDAAPQQVPLSGIGSGAGNEFQTLSVVATSSNPSLIPPPVVAYASANSTGSLTLAPLPNVDGTATITVTVNDLASSNNLTVRTFNVTVLPLNDPPSLSDIADQVTGEDRPLGLTLIVSDLDSSPASLTVSGRSSDTNLVPDAGFIFGGAGAVRTLLIIPAPNRSGVATVTVTVADTNGGSASDTFMLTVVPIIDPPSISLIADQSVGEGTETAAIGFTIDDPENNGGALSLWASSSNTNLVPNTSLALSGANSNKTLLLSPKAGQLGSTTITLTASNFNGSSSRAFPFIVYPVNHPPTLAALADRIIEEDAGPQTVALSGIGSGETNEEQLLTVTARSSDPSLIPDPVVAYATPQSHGILTFAPSPNANGVATITVTVEDGALSNNLVAVTFTVTVTNRNDPPVISDIPNTSTQEEIPKTIAFTIGDAETPAGDLVVTGTSSNGGLIPNSHIVFGGSGSNRTVTLTPEPNQSGSAIVTVTVTDTNDISATDTFVVTVNPVNDPPVISSIADQITAEDTTTGTIEFTVGDRETPATALILQANSSNGALVANIFVGGSGTNRSLIIRPATNQFGSTVITITVRDPEGGAATQAFVLTVSPVNDPPTISPPPNATTRANTPISMGFTVADVETAPGELLVTRSSSNTNLIPNASIVLGGTGANRTVTVTPASNQIGSATIRLIVTDPQLGSSTNSFTLSVTTPSLPPVITSQPQSQSVSNGGTVAFSVGATGSAPLRFQWMRNSANLSAATNASLVLSNLQPVDAGLYQVMVTNQFGSSTSGVATLVINLAPQRPTISNITNKTTAEDTPIAIPFVVTDPDTPASRLSLTVTSTNTILAPTNNIFVDGNGTNRTLFVFPATNQVGTTLITVTVGDGLTNVSDTFVLTVTAVNDPPTLNPPTNVALIANFPNIDVPFNGAGSGASNENQNLTVTAVSSNAALITVNRVNYRSPDATGSIRLESPANNAIGTSVVAVTISDGITNLTRRFTVFVRASANAVPTASVLTNQVTTEDTPTGLIPFTVGDSGTPAALLALSAISSNTNLVPNSGILFGGSGSNRTIRVTPAPNQSGSSLITISVVDTNFGLANRSFTLTVNPVNDPPIISALSNLTINANTITPSLGFTVSDLETAAANLGVSAASSNTNLVPNANIVLGGSGPNRAMVVTPVTNRTGTTTISVTVTDNSGGVTNTSFLLTVTGVGIPPLISHMTDQMINEDVATGEIGFVVGHPNEAASLLSLTGSSSDPSLVPNSNIRFGGTGVNRTVTVSPQTNQFGSARITITVTDTSGNSASEGFILTVIPVNDFPTLDAVDNLVFNQNAGPQSLALNGIGPGAANESQPLTLSALSSDPGLIPDPAVTYSSASSSGVLTLAPTSGSNGTATITVTVNDGQNVNNLISRTFTVSVRAAPVMTPVADQNLDEDTTMAPLAFTVSDADSPVMDLTVTASSSNPALVPTTNISVEGNDTNRSVTLWPVASGFGVTTITLTVMDPEGNSSSNNFVVTVHPVNDPPTLNPISDLTINQNAGPQVVNLGGISAGPANEMQPLNVLAISTNPALIPAPVVNYESPNSAGTLTLTPMAGAGGTARITVVVDDGQADNGSTSQSFDVTVLQANSPPTLSLIPDQVMEEDYVKVVGFIVGDAETAPGDLRLRVSSSNTNLVPDSGLAFSGSGASRALTIVPGTNQSGSATITVSVFDGNDGMATGSFGLTVNSRNDAPTISHIANQSIDQDGTTGALPFTIGDLETPVSGLTLTASSSNPSLAPALNVVFGGSGATPTVRVTPVLGRHGSATITITVSDGQGGTASQAFLLTVNVADELPTISIIPDQVINEDQATAAIPFMVGDPETVSLNLAVTGHSLNPLLVPNTSIFIGGSGSNRTIRVSPRTNQFGTALITVTVTDPGGNTASDTFVLSVLPIRDDPIMSEIPDQVTEQDTAKVIAFTVGSADTAASNLVVSATSSNPALVPNAGLLPGFSGAVRTLTMLPATNQVGVATITVKVIATAGGVATRSFLLTVNPPTGAPLITSQPVGQTVAIGQNVSFKVLATSQAGMLSYQWRHNDVDLPGQRSATLALTEVHLSNAGNYTVLVSNSVGSVTSSIAVLRVVAQPFITEIRRAGTGTSLSFTTMAGISYTVEFMDPMTSMTWETFNPVAGNGNVMMVNDEAEAPMRLYRVRAD